MNWRRATVALIAASVAVLVSEARAAPDLANAKLALPIAFRSAPSAPAGTSEPLQDPTGDAEAMNERGVAQLLSARTPSDYLMALYWLQQAIDGGSVDAMYNLARMYLHGIGTPRDYANAYKWFKRSAQGGCVHGMHVLAVMAENGLGTTRDLPLARAMYREAASSGIPAAMVWVSDDLAREARAQRDLVEAQAWLQVASQLDLDEQRQILVLAKMEELGAKLGPDDRDGARALASRIVAGIRERALGEASDRGAAARPSPQALQRPPSTSVTEVRPLPISAGVGPRIGRGAPPIGHSKDMTSCENMADFGFLLGQGFEF
jgi:hypothetical protein